MHSSDELSASIPPVSASRAAILAASRRPEAICVKSLIEDASLPASLAAQAETTARQLAAYMRGNAENNGVESMMQAFPPGSEEGAAIMTLAEALLRIPDSATRDTLIRDQIGHIEWQRHTGRDKPPLAHAAAWAMAMAARLHSGPNGLRALATWGGAPLIRRRVEQVVKTITSQFTPGETMAHALRHAAPQERRGFRHTYAPLCEPALTGADGARQRHDLIMALEALARHAQDTTAAPLHERPELAVRLSSLHPRLEYTQRRHILTELLPTLGALAAQARALNIGLVFDAEESACLNISLDVFEALCALPELKGWNGLGLTVQAAMRHAPALIDHIVELARQGRRRITVRLVKGDFQNVEIKRAQVERHTDFPVFTRKNHTDISYLACARRLLDAPDALFPQFATHNARTVATILALTEGRSSETYEFQCLHGVAETLYAPLVSRNGLNLPCRIYAPVGTQEHMTSYLMRRLTESSARSSFVQQIANHTLPLDTVIADPVRHLRTSATPGAPEPKLRPPRHLFAPGWISAPGTDLDDPAALDTLYSGMGSTAIMDAAPITPGISSATEAGWDAVPDPSDPADTVGTVRFADDHAVQAALASADAASSWARTAPADRARCLDQAATLLEDGHAHVVSLLIRESGRTLSGALDEIRNAADHLRHHAAQIRQDLDPAAHAPLGVMLCISPWNLPLSVLTGQMAAALAAGNTVIAKPSEKTPLVAAVMVRLLLKAGVPPDALHLLPGNDLVGAELVADPRVDGVLFTGTTATARTVSRALLGRRGRTGQPIPLITATGALNAMLVDSSASPAQAVRDIVISAFGNAGTDCASLRILLVQDEIADQIIDMLCGAMRELRMGDPSRPDTDIGPLISADARLQVDDHIDRMRRAGRHVWQATPVPDGTNGHFVPPTLIEIGRVADIGGEVLGPVLHLRRFARGELDGVVDAVNATGYALSFGVQSRVRSTIARVCARSNAGNLYVNRDMTRAAVGSRPFGGKGLSGTGPKAGSRLLLARLTLCGTDYRPPLPGTVPAAARALLAFLEPRDPPSARRVRGAIANALQGSHTILAGPVGETNRYSLRPRGNVICAGESWPAILYAVGMALGTGNTALVLAPDASVEWMTRLPRTLSNAIRRIDAGALPECDAMLVQVGCELAEQAAQTVTAREGLVVPVYDAEKVRPEWLLDECVLTTNTAAIGGDVTLSALH